MLLLASIFIQMLATPFIYLLTRARRRVGELASAVASLIPFLIVLSLFPVVYGGGRVWESYPWISSLGLHLSLLLDELSYPFALLISLMGFLATIYSMKYMEREHGYESYMALLMLFGSGMMGVILVQNLFLFYIFWELMLVPSYFLIAYWGTGKPRVIGFKYFIFTHAGALAMLLGIIWIFTITGALEFSEVAGATRAMGASSTAIVIASLLFVGAAVKMAVFPFHTWLPDAHAEAPTPISVLLSGVMIKTGVYALARIVMGFLPQAFSAISSAVALLAVATMVWGGLMAMVQSDVKRLLAYSSVSQMGYILFGLVALAPVGVAGSLFHVLNHGFAKGMLFMGAGVLIHELNERDLGKLGGLASRMPITAMAFLLGGLSIAGTPPLGGFASEWMIFSGAMESGMPLYTAIAIVATAITAGYYLRMMRAIFFLKPKRNLDGVGDAPPTMAATISALLALVVILGFLNYPITSIISRAAASII